MAASRRPTTERALLWLEGLLAVGAVGGAVALLTGTTDLGPATSELPFGSVALAGWALLAVNGLLPAVVMVAALRGHPLAPRGHLLVGLALVGWIVVQVAFLGWPPHGVQIAYFLYGWAIVALAVPLQRPRTPVRMHATAR